MYSPSSADMNSPSYSPSQVWRGMKVVAKAPRPAPGTSDFLTSTIPCGTERRALSGVPIRICRERQIFLFFYFETRCEPDALIIGVYSIWNMIYSVLAFRFGEVYSWKKYSECACKREHFSSFAEIIGNNFNPFWQDDVRRYPEEAKSRAKTTTTPDLWLVEVFMRVNGKGQEFRIFAAVDFHIKLCKCHIFVAFDQSPRK